MKNKMNALMETVNQQRGQILQERITNMEHLIQTHDQEINNHKYENDVLNYIIMSKRVEVDCMRTEMVKGNEIHSKMKEINCSKSLKRNIKRNIHGILTAKVADV